MDKVFDLEIISPVKSLFSGKVKYVTAPGTMGEFQVLYNHAAMVSSLQIGIIKIKDEGDKELKFSTSGGILEVKKNKVSILSDAVESKDDLDINRAKKAIERAEKRKAENDKDFDRARAMLSIARAKNRLHLAELDK